MNLHYTIPLLLCIGCREQPNYTIKDNVIVEPTKATSTRFIVTEHYWQSTNSAFPDRTLYLINDTKTGKEYLGSSHGTMIPLN